MIKSYDIHNQTNLTDEEIYNAYTIAAKVVSTYGDEYLPIFSRLHLEIEKIEQKRKLKVLAEIVMSR